ncbi:metal-dependent hydrolase [Aetokthonos hydrillicola Thurmond2011]|uniref:Metal-dependent hydrolase n=2 Tax=Aetokthonos TaxID=1550243 RepID=A0AAP5IFC9_9CYAN|nr:metal-dependent hydrolase [Aetokthonos hydrillicola]MBO3461217.1 metal-dependent hydrolase [Aetokthonos hydrillicola CCALA 1050]MDR9900224.1 metal-dependent hydrolase [Aetokthonos hydrillicola Thurmond2011]
MMGWTHMVVSATATSLILGTANPAVIAVGAVSGLLPDVDISTSFAGQILPWISRWLERRFPHRSCTHSLAASGFIAAVSYGITYLTGGKFWQIATAISIGYFFGWFIDAFTKSGVEMFYPSPVRCVCPSNRNFRLKSGSSQEYGLLILVMAIAVFSFNINANGGVLTQFNRLIAAPSGVEQIYNESGSSHLIKAHIKGVMTSDRSPVLGDFLIIQSLGNGFVVQAKDGKLYKAGTDPESQILINRVTADSSEPAVTTIESIVLEDDELSKVLSRFDHDNAMVFVSGEITIDDPDIKFALDPHQFPFIKRSQTTDSPGVKLEVAPLKYVKKKLGDQFATGQLSIRSITTTGRLNNERV